MRKEDFLRFPDTDYCTSILSIASPGSGKTYILLKCLKAWIDMGMFEEYHVILPTSRGVIGSNSTSITIYIKQIILFLSCFSCFNPFSAYFQP